VADGEAGRVDLGAGDPVPVQSDVLGGRTSIGQLLVLDIVRGNTQKVDILNVMGPAIAGAAVLWGLARTPGWRIAGSIAAASAFAFATPGIRAWAALDALPDASRATLRPFAGRTTFSFFPWAGFVLPARRSACSSIARATPHPSAG
jgi:hypothetical protein